MDLPPGQILTGKFPVVGEERPISVGTASWTLSVTGLVGQPRRFAIDSLLTAQQSRDCDIHCVTGWSKRAVRLHGLPLFDLLQPLGLSPEARFVRFIAASPRRHDSSLPLDVALADTWLVHAVDGEPLSVEHGGPLRAVTPSRYFYKSVKWLTEIELLHEDRLGYWERESAYHNEGDFLQEQRFDPARLANPADVAALKVAEDMTPWRGRTIIRARLGGWEPRTSDLRGLSLKYCSLRNARLAEMDLRNVNLSLSNLEGADLRGSDLRGADIEGANFAGADLRGARLDGVTASATRFFREFKSGRQLSANVAGATFIGARGLLEAQRAFLESQGALL